MPSVLQAASPRIPIFRHCIQPTIQERACSIWPRATSKRSRVTKSHSSVSKKEKLSLAPCAAGQGSHRPKLIAFESKILQGKRPEALYDVVEFCAQRGYKPVGPVMANHVCVRGD